MEVVRLVEVVKKPWMRGLPTEELRRRRWAEQNATMTDAQLVALLTAAAPPWA